MIRFSWADQFPDGDSKDTSPIDSGSGNSARNSASRPLSMVGMIMPADVRRDRTTPAPRSFPPGLQAAAGQSS